MPPINFSLCSSYCFQCCSNNFTFGIFPGDQSIIKLDKCRLLLINSLRLFVVSLHLDVALSAFIIWDSHSENKISLCDSCIFGKLASFPSFESFHDRKLVNLSSAFSNSSLASTDFSIIDAQISHKGMENDILWHRISNCQDKALVISKASVLNSFIWGYPLNRSIRSFICEICSSFDFFSCSLNSCSLLNAWDKSYYLWMVYSSILWFSCFNCSFNSSLRCLCSFNCCSSCYIFCCCSTDCASSWMIAWPFSFNKWLTSEALSIVLYMLQHTETLFLNL